MASFKLNYLAEKLNKKAEKRNKANYKKMRIILILVRSHGSYFSTLKMIFTDYKPMVGYIKPKPILDFMNK